MNTLKQIWAVIFPYRSHLEDEVVYLRSQLAQRDRRLVELQDTLTVIATGSNRPPRPAREPQPPAKIQPVGWDAKRAHDRRERENGRGEAAAAISAPDADAAGEVRA